MTEEELGRFVDRTLEAQQEFIAELIAEVRRYRAMAAKWKREATGISRDLETPERYEALLAEDPELDEVQP